MSGRWTAPSDYDYYDPGRHDGLERSCGTCGDPVMVARNEQYQVQVYCDTCREKPEPLQIECGWCGVVLHEGAVPRSTGLCASCKIRLLAEADRKHHPKTGTRG